MGDILTSPDVYWKCDAATTPMADAGSLGASLTLVGSPTLGSGAKSGLGGSLVFDGSTQYGYTAANGPSGTGPITLACWMKSTSSLDNRHVLNVGLAGTSTAVILILHLGGMKFAQWGGAGLFVGSLNDGAWHHVLSTYDPDASLYSNAGWYFYVDGAFQVYYADTTTNVTAYPIYVAEYQGGGDYHFPGSLDEIRIATSTASAAKAAALFAFNGGGGGSGLLMRRRRQMTMQRHEERDDWEKRGGLWQMDKKLAA